MSSSSWKSGSVFKENIEGLRSCDSSTHGVITEVILKVKEKNQKRAENGIWDYPYLEGKQARTISQQEIKKESSETGCEWVRLKEEISAREFAEHFKEGVVISDNENRRDWHA